jgi:hypothetical protein
VEFDRRGDDVGEDAPAADDSSGGLITTGLDSKEQDVEDLITARTSERYDFHLQALLARLFDQALQLASGIRCDPLLSALAANGRRHVADHHHTEPQVHTVSSIAWSLIPATDGTACSAR